MLPVLLFTLVGQTINPRPGVVPTLREWSGGVGTVSITNSSHICLPAQATPEWKQVARTLQADLKELFSCSPKIVSGTSKEGDIVLQIGDLEPKLKAEGYTLDIQGGATITASTPTGAFYGTRSLLQMMVLNRRPALPRGSVRDWPDYGERGFLLDTGRKFFPISFLRQYARFMGWYKMNDFQLHLNDNGFHRGTDWAKTYSAFRLQSEHFPGLTAQDGSYSRRDIEGLQDLAASQGVTITPEIDAPAHALAFTKYRPDLASPKYGNDHMDLSNPNAVEFIKQVWDEFVPWFRSPYAHIGADEYSSAEEAHTGYKNYINQVSSHLKSKGKKVRMWGGLKVGGGAEGVDRDIVVSLWYPGYHDPKDAVKEGYKLINTQDGYLYIVPFAGYYYQFLNSRWLYEKWVPNEFGDEAKFPYQDPSILGGMFAVWNDKTDIPYTKEDVHELVLPAMPTVAEKLWSGPSQGKRSYIEFQRDFEALGAGPFVKIAPPKVAPEPGDLAFGKAITATVRNSGNFGPATLVDGRAPTRWFADTKENPKITLDFGKPELISQVILSWMPYEFATEYELFGSLDGINWQRLFSTQRGIGGKEKLHFAANNLRYLRLQIPAQKAKTVSLLSIEAFR